MECAGHVKYADFGEAATNLFGSRTETTNAGTETYRAPEVSYRPIEKLMLISSWTSHPDPSLSL